MLLSYRRPSFYLLAGLGLLAVPRRAAPEMPPVAAPAGDALSARRPDAVYEATVARRLCSLLACESALAFPITRYYPYPKVLDLLMKSLQRALTNQLAGLRRP